MPTLLAQIAPQRSTQYADLARQLAPHELAASPIGPLIQAINPVTLAGQAYLRCELSQNLEECHLQELGWLAMTSAFFEYYDRLADMEGPFLKPLAIPNKPHFPPDLITTRRYQGKTNELFTHFLCNLARFTSDFADRPWSELRLFDPLCGGGTTLFIGLVLGANVAGIEKLKNTARSTATFLKQYTKEQEIPCTVKDERLKKLDAHRWWFTLGDHLTQQCMLVKGESERSRELIAGFKKPHLIVTDLPYGIQHKGPLQDLLSESLPGWASLLTPGGTLVFSWDATRFPRAEMIKRVQTGGPFRVLNTPPYDQFAHQVDRVIKHRDVIVAVTEIP